MEGPPVNGQVQGVRKHLVEHSAERGTALKQQKGPVHLRSQICLAKALRDSRRKVQKSVAPARARARALPRRRSLSVDR